MKKIISTLLMLVMLLSLSVTAFADAPNINYVGGKKIYAFNANTTQYTDTDMFANFKNMMPGDSRTQEITLKNSLTGYYKITVYFKAIPHTDNSGDNAATYAGHPEPFTAKDLADMQEFLSCFDMTITNRRGEILYNGPASIGGPEDWRKITTLNRGESATITVTLTADIERLTNDYAGKIGEVDWKFRADEVPYEPTEPRTGDASQIWLYAAICLVSAAAVVGILVIKKKKAE